MLAKTSDDSCLKHTWPHITTKLLYYIIDKVLHIICVIIKKNDMCII